MTQILSRFGTEIQDRLSTIELTPGPQGADGRDGEDGTDGAPGPAGPAANIEALKRQLAHVIHVVHRDAVGHPGAALTESLILRVLNHR